MKFKLFKWTWMIVALALLAPACLRTFEDDMGVRILPEGTPITMRLNFGASDLIDLNVSTKAEATPADEERIHDLYVFIFCNNPEDDSYGNKIYGRYFSYEHLKSSLSALDSSPNEGWWMENRTIPDSEHPEKNIDKTRGAVKISTKVCEMARIVVIANIDNGICKLGNETGFGNDMLDYLNGIRTWSDLQKTQVKLTQDVVNRKDLFLMMGTPEDGSGNLKNVNTGEMVWGSTTPSINYNSYYTVKLRPVDAKVKFKIRINERNNDGSIKNNYISAAKAVYWEVDNTPDRCYLFSDYAPEGTPAGTHPAPEGTVYFTTEPAYFDGTVTENGVEWYVFSFYMLESRFAAKAHASYYTDREKKIKSDTGEGGYQREDGALNPPQRDDDHYVKNGEWIYAMPYAPYVKFDMILTLTPAGVSALGGNVEHALTSDTIYSIHLGDFSHDLDDYETLRSICYTYEITIANSGSIYAEVKLDDERQPGQEGYLLLTDDEIVNSDCHYEYHSITFTYSENTSPEKFSWYVKTPFTSQVGGGPTKGTKTYEGEDYPTYDPHDTDGTLLDYRWVKFGINAINNGTYGTERIPYPGNDAYNKNWGKNGKDSEGHDYPGPWNSAHPDLMDISQLIQYIFQQTDKRKAWAKAHQSWEESGRVGDEPVDDSDFLPDPEHSGSYIIRATIFIDEYYYEYDPRDESDTPQPDPNLWRQFVNAQPREMHILSKTVQSRDRMSDVIESSHSVIQQSIQTIYNIYEPNLRSIWGCEHLDEIKLSDDPNWTYWPEDCTDATVRAGDDKMNGRLNSAYIWGLAKKNGTYPDNAIGVREWEHFLKYDVNNNVPELREDEEQNFRGLAWSCLTRNRDNNGNHQIDEEEVRWYLASTEQLAGIWVGTESLSTSARLYQPATGQWRAHVVSSTKKLVSWAEEGGGATAIEYDWVPRYPYYTWADEETAAAGESVRCIRNIGTYDGPGGVTDISYAPVTFEPDTYFSLERHSGNALDEFDCSVRGGEDNDDYFIFYFDRLNTNSIREYSPGELPYHDQMSLNNRVYKKMVTQPLSLDMPEYSEKLGEINNKVTQKGHNDYCPEGYRFPNHTEWLLMSLYLPGNYLQKGKNGENYSNVYPSRTYYDRGYYGSLRSDTEPWNTEKGKVGWLFSGKNDKAKMHCSPYNETIKRSRCVKDDDQTGVITGKMAIEGQEIYPGDVIPIDFKFSSTASTFTDAKLTLWYKKGDFLMPYDLTSQLKTPTGLQYKGTQYITIPTLADLGLSTGALPINAVLADNDMSIEVEFTNLSGRTGSHKLPVKMINPLDGVCAITDAVGGNKIFPSDQNQINLTLHTIAHEQYLSGATLKLCYDDKEITIENIPELIGGNKTKTYTRSTIDIPTLAELTDISVEYLNSADKTVTLKATVSTTYDNTSKPGTETLTKEFTQTLSISNPVIANSFAIDDAASSKLYPGDRNHVNLSFESRGHNGTLSSASLKLMNGENVVEDYSSSLTPPSTNNYTLSNFEIAIPSLSPSLALGDELRLVASASNSDGLYKTLDITNLILSNPVSGTMTADSSIYPDDNSLSHVTIDFSSAANTLNLTSATLELYDGVSLLHTFTLTQPSGKTYNPGSGPLTLTIPSLATLGISGTDFEPVPLTLRLTVNAGTFETVVNQPVTLRSHASAEVEIVPGHTTTFPVKSTLALLGSAHSISSAKLMWNKNGGSWNEYSLTAAVGDQTVGSTDDLGVTGLSNGTYINYKVQVACSDGTTIESPVWSMQLMRYNYEPNGAKWSDLATHLDFEAGAYIEMLIAGVGATPHKGELLGIGIGNVPSDCFYSGNAEPKKTLHAFYRDPSKEGGKTLFIAGWNPTTDNYRTIKYTVDFSSYLLRLDKDGLIYNVGGGATDQTVPLSNNNLGVNFDNITASDHLLIGSEQGANRSKAHYDYIRVVKQYEMPAP